MNKNKMKQRLISLILKLIFSLSIILFSACQFNLDSPKSKLLGGTLINSEDWYDSDSPDSGNTKNPGGSEATQAVEKTYSINGSVVTDGAVPSVLKKSSNSENPSDRTALPVLTSSVIYRVRAENPADASDFKETFCKSENPTYTLEVKAGVWNVTVTGFLGSTAADCIAANEVFCSESPASFDTSLPNGPLDLTVIPITKSGEKGSALLTVSVEDNSKIKSAEITWQGSKNGGTGKKVLDFSSGSSGFFDFNSNYNPADPVNYPFDIQSDIYKVTFTFYNGAVSGGTVTGSVVYKCSEVVNVFKNLQTDLWVNTGSAAYITSSGFSVTNTCVSSFSRVHYYINGVTGSLGTTVSGTSTDPFKNLEQANNYITTNTGDLRKEKTLYFHVRADSSYSQPVTLADYKELVIIGENETSQKELKKLSAQGRSTGDLFIKSNVKLDNILLEKTETFLDLDSPQKKLTLCNAATVNCSIKLANLTSKIYVDCSDYSNLSINLSYKTKPNKGEPIVYPLEGTLSSAITDKFVFTTGNANILYDEIKNAGVFNRETDIYFNANSSETTANGSKQYPFKVWNDVSSNVESEDTVYLMSDVSNFSGFMCPVTICSYQDAANPTAVYSVNAGTALRINFQTQSSTAPIIVENINIDGNNKELWLSGSVNSGADYGVIFRNCRIENVTAVTNSAMAEFDSTEISAEKYYCGNNWHSTFKNSTATFTLFSLTKYNTGSLIKITDPDIKAWATFDSSSHLYADFINVSEPDSLTVYNLPQPVSAVDPVASVQNYTFVNYCDAVAGTTLINYTGSTVPDLSKLTAGNCSTSTSGTNYTIIQNPSDSTKLCAAFSLKYYMDKNSTATYSNGSEFAPFQSLYALLNIVKNITLASPADVIEIYLKSDSSSLSVSALTSFNKNLKICGVRDAANPDAMYKIDLSITTSTASTASPTIELENVLIAHANNANNPLINMKKGTLKLTNVAIENNDTKKSLVTMTSGNLIMTNVTIENKATGIVRSPLYLGSGTIAKLNSVDINGFGTNSSSYSDSKGAIYCEGSLNYKDGIISDCRNEYIGAGITLSGSAEALLEDVVFKDCSIGKPLSGSASGISQGGANIHVGDNAKLTIKGSTHGTVTKTSDSTYNYSNDIALTKNSAANFKVEGLTSASVCNLTLTTNFAVGDVLFSVLDGDSNTENLFSIVYPGDKGWGPKYDPAGNTCIVGLAETVYTDWASLVAAVEYIPSGTTEETEFIISGTLNADSIMTVNYPVKLIPRGNVIIKRDSAFIENIFKLYEKFTLAGTTTDKIVVDGNNVNNPSSIISCSDSLECSYTTFKNHIAKFDSLIYISTSGANINFENCSFISNTGSIHGTVISSVDVQKFTLKNCKFDNNSIDSNKSAIDLKSGNYIFENVTMLNNQLDASDAYDIRWSTTNQSDALTFSGTTSVPLVLYNYGFGTSNSPKTPILLKDFTGSVEIQLSNTGYELTSYQVLGKEPSSVMNLADMIENCSLNNAGFEFTATGYVQGASVLSIADLCGGATLPDASIASPTFDQTKTYTISTEGELRQLSLWSNSKSISKIQFKLTDDIDLSAGGNFTPIGQAYNFNGTFDGNNKTIKGLSVYMPTSEYVGLFGKTAANLLIKNLTVEGSVSGRNYVGGILGQLYGSTTAIVNCVSNVKVTSAGNACGGIVGIIKSGYVINCINLDSVTASGTAQYAGGIAGTGEAGSIYNSANIGKITASNYAGGITGFGTGTGIINAYNAGIVKITDAEKFNFGYIDGNGAATYSNCYYINTVAGGKPFGNGSTNATECTDVTDLNKKINLYALTASSVTVNSIDYDINLWNKTFVAGEKIYPSCLDCSELTISDPMPANLSDLSEAPTTGTFSVSSVSEFNQLSSWVEAGSTMENVTLVIDTPVSITGTWTPIGTDTHPFKGTVEGNGQTIELDNNTGGLFGNVKDAKLKNINLKSSVNGSGTYVGGLVGKGSGVLLIENCSMDGYFSTNSATYVGGIIGYVDGSSTDNIVIRNCYNKQGVNGTSYVGGIVGYISENPNSVRIENCGNRGAINTSLTGAAGGILGGTDNTNVSIVNCFNQADSIPKTSEGSIAGEIPAGNTGTIDYCYIHVNYAGVEPDTVSYIGTGSSFTVGSNCYLFSVDSLVPKRIINKTYENDLADILNDWCNLNGSEYKKWTYDAAGNIEFVD